TDPKKSKSLVLIILLFIIMLTVLIIIFVLSSYKSKPTADNANNNQQTNNTNKESQPNIADWKVYENKEYGFRIDYSKEWKARENKKDSNNLNTNVVNLISPDLLNPDDPLILDSDKWEIYEKIKNFNSPDLDNFFTYNSDISVFHYPKSKLINRHGVETIKELAEINDGTVTEISKTRISGIEAMDFMLHGYGISYVTIFESNGYFYEIVLNRTSSKEDISDTIKQVLSTFQLIK
ncbi:hypothetical protein KJ980_08720, partial [Patescibacteria group bacterium]|nr:hypothetical protein [Patescibacteria group bacterium]